MQYMILIYSNPELYAALSKQEQDSMMPDYFAFNAETAKRGALVQGAPLHPVTTARTLRIRDGKQVVTDGPFAETKEVLGGYYLLNCQSLDEAIDLAKQIPDAKCGSVEIRPVVDFSQQA
ncbi:MAG TPA: YciI family protein [Aggregatilineales bacterium]|nr:YciI family protein [Aggregatilineales bacterium]